MSEQNWYENKRTALRVIESGLIDYFKALSELGEDNDVACEELTELLFESGSDLEVYDPN